MTRPQTRLSTQAGTAAVAGATTWIALLSWRGFTTQPTTYLWPLLALGVIVGVVGALGRWWRIPGPGVVLAQVVLSAMVASTIICGAPIPIGSAGTRLVDAFRDAMASANQYAPPVPAGVPSVDPYLIVGGLACLLLVDILACTVRRVPLAGLPLLTIYSVPVGMIGGGVTWWIFTLTAVGFLSLLFLHETENVARWGRRLDQQPGAVDDDSQGFGVRTGAIRTSASAIGGVVTVLAIAVPLAVPTLSVHLFDFGAGPGGGDNIDLTNPMVSLQRDLRRGNDVDLLTVRTDDPDPKYLRIAVLNKFQDDRWSAGDRDVPASNRALGALPALAGVSPAVPRSSYEYQVSASSSFASTWLPTTQNVSTISAAGDWRYDTTDMDFLASDDHLTTAGLNYDFTGVKLVLDANTMASAGTAASLVGKQFTDLPNNLDPSVRNLALAVTRDEDTALGKAVALQQFFRQDGGFVYDDTVHLGDGSDDLKAFLTQGGNGRRGYCQQFAASMAVMARTLGIPARVAVGFLSPQPTGPDTYVYSAHDMHAWPELYFSGAGWVRFEPTPPGRAEEVPAYTSQTIDLPDDLPSVATSASAGLPVRGDQTNKAQDLPDKTKADQSTPGSSFPWGRVAGGIGLAVLVLAALSGPWLVRRRRRDRRQVAGPEEAWAELRDTALDLRVPWPRDRSPRETRDALVRHFGAPPDEFTPERPQRGAQTNPTAILAIDRIVTALERLRYARADSSTDGTWRAEVGSCVEALFGGAPRSARRWATWWPRSVFSRPTPIRVRPVDRDQQPVYAGVVDHVGGPED